MATILNVLFEERLGGPQRRVLQVGRGLRAQGTETVVVIPRGEPAFARLLREAGVPFHEMDLVRLRDTWNPAAHARFVRRFWPNVMELRRLIRRLAATGARSGMPIVHTNGLLHLQAAIAAHLEGAPLVWHLNDVCAPAWARRLILPLVERWADRIAVSARAVERFYFPDCHAERSEASAAARNQHGKSRFFARLRMTGGGDGDGGMAATALSLTRPALADTPSLRSGQALSPERARVKNRQRGARGTIGGDGGGGINGIEAAALTRPAPADESAGSGPPSPAGGGRGQAEEGGAEPWLQRGISQRVHLLYAPVDTRRFSPEVDGLAIRQELGIGGGAPVIGVVTNLSPGKGVQYLLEAAPRILQRFPAARFLVVGAALRNRRAYARLLERRTRELGLGGRVTFTGARRDIPQVCRALTVYVQTSESEACPMAVMEASASGVPVVATNVGGTPELVEDGVTGILVPPRSPEAIAEAVLRLLDGPALARRMGAAGAERMRRLFSLEACVERHMRLYADLSAAVERSPKSGVSPFLVPDNAGYNRGHEAANG